MKFWLLFFSLHFSGSCLSCPISIAMFCLCYSQDPDSAVYKKEKEKQFCPVTNNSLPCRRRLPSCFLLTLFAPRSPVLKDLFGCSFTRTNSDTHLPKVTATFLITFLRWTRWGSQIDSQTDRQANEWTVRQMWCFWYFFFFLVCDYYIVLQ